MIFSLRSNMISRRLSLGQRNSTNPAAYRRGSSTSSSIQQCETTWRTQSVDNTDSNVNDWIDRSVYVRSSGVTSDSDEYPAPTRSSEDDLKLGAEAIVSDMESPGGSEQRQRKAETSFIDKSGTSLLQSQDSESSWTSNLTASSHNSKALSSFSQISSIANVDGIHNALDSLPMTATDVLYNLGFAATDTIASVPKRFLGPTHANLGEWNGQVFWSDQTSPISNFDYLFNMMDDIPAMDDEAVDGENSHTDSSFKSALSFSNSKGESSWSSFDSASQSVSGGGSPGVHFQASPSKATKNAPQKPSLRGGSQNSNRPKMIRSHSLPEAQTSSSSQQSKDSATSDKPFVNKMKLKRHRSQLCLQQSFDTINEEEEDSYKFPVSAIEKLETIEGSFSQSVDSISPYAAKPSTHFCNKTDTLDESNNETSDGSELTETSRTSFSSEKKGAKLERQSCEEVYQDNQHIRKNQHEITWEQLRSKLEAVERRVWNIAEVPQKEKRKIFSKSSLSLPSFSCERISQPLRRCVTMFNDVMIEETETDTSESYSEHSVVNSSRSRFETSEDFSLPILESPESTNENTIDLESTWLAPTIKVEQFLTDSSTEELHLASQEGKLYTPDDLGRPISPCLSNASEETIIPEQDEKTDNEKMETVAVSAGKVGIPRRQRLMKMKSAVLFSSRNANYKSPFYIVTPKLRFYRKRSSSMPLLYRPALVRSKLRRAVTENPHSLTNIIEEYDADLDDEELAFEQEELESRICDSIFKSITSSSKEDLLQQIEDRVEGTSDEAVRIKKNSRKKKSSFSKSGDECSLSSSEQEGNSDNLTVKPRRKRRKSRDKRIENGWLLSPSISHCDTISDPLSIQTEMENTELSELPSEQSQSSDVLVIEKSLLNQSMVLKLDTLLNPYEINDHSQIDENSTESYLVQSEDKNNTVGVSNIRICDQPSTKNLENNASIVKHEQNNRDGTLSSGSTDDSFDVKNRNEWELQVLRDVIKHFEEDYEKSEKALETKRSRDKQIRMEIKMLKTQIAVHKMDKKLRGEFKPTSTSTPRQNSLADKDSSGNHSNSFYSKSKCRTGLDSFLLNACSFAEK